MRILVVDDEPPARRRLVSLLGDIAVGEVAGEAENGAEALQMMARSMPDVLLLDIRMPGMDGLEVARHLAGFDDPPAVIFTTAYDMHALAAFETHAVDYLLKPIRRERLKAALDKAVRLTRAQLGGLRGKQARARTHISATLHRKLHLLPVDEIRFFQADQKYVSVGYRDGLVLIEEPLKALEAEFQDRFMRVHRNALVAVRYVESLEREARDRYAVHLKDVAEPLEVSRRLLTAVKRRLKGP